jgi:EAL domain-containing protein (putative c-di-GMP-specific phosphodiesterase class I)/ActR/RegA family two-component response regulator
MAGEGGKNHLGRVLVADDDVDVRKVCARILGHEGWHVTACENARVAIAETERAQVPFDCVLSDINMPEMNGFELVKALRAKDDDLPVLLMTGDPSLDGAVRAIDYGAVSYIAKPFDHEALAMQVARAARRHGVQRMRRRAESWAREVYGDAKELGSLEARFARAIETSWMAFQPILDVTNRTVFAYEALLRTEEESLRRPDIFIATAERLDKIQLLGRTVRAAVARAATELPGDALLFVNVHGLELTDEELFSPHSPLAAFAPRVVLEITERTGIDPAAGPTRVAMLRRLGYRIAVDDLGAGYAALGALATLEPDIVKLDMSLIHELERHSTKRRIVASIASLCRELGSRVVAEGVETLPERLACVESGIDLLQGFLFARPARGFTTVTW